MLKESPLTEYLTEQEQIQQLKNWIKQYGPTIIAGVLIAIAVTSAWHYWQNYQNKILIHASSIYDEMLTLRAQGNSSAALTQANKLRSHYAKTPYAQMAAYMLAREAVLKKNYPAAIKNLQWVIAHSRDTSMQQIARLRIARILITEKKPQEALEFLKKVDDKSFAGMIAEVKGDAYFAMNQIDSAKKTYELALQELPNAEVTRPILQMKYDNLTS